MLDAFRPTLIVDVGAVVENFSRLRERARAAACGASIKADCYGLGMAQLAPALHQAGCRDFFVATLDEGIAARQVVPSGNIYVLYGPSSQDNGGYGRNDLVPVLNSMAQIDDWLERPDIDPRNGVALHIDTGMARLGMPAAEVQQLLNDPQRLQALNIALIMSHLACAEETASEMNGQQLKAFADLQAQLLKVLPKRPRFSLANSSGIFLGPEYHFDLVRPGAALYGLNPTPEQPNPMMPVATMLTRIIQVRPIDAGKCVGYGATHRFSRPTRLATIAIGYADGLMRSQGNRGVVHVGEVRAPIVGRVSMDLVTIDVGNVPEHLARPGATVEILGPRQDADALGLSAGTNGYEVLTAFGRHCRRHYKPAE